MVDRGFVEPRDRSEWARNEVQFVLDNEVGRIERPAVPQRPPKARLRRTIEADAILESVDMTKERAGLADPWQCRELVYRCDEECPKRR